MAEVEIAGIISVCDFPLAPLMAIKLSQNVDYMVIAYDLEKGHLGNGYGGQFHYELLKKLAPFECKVKHYKREKGGHRAGEEMLRQLDSIRPKYVFQCDSDETFPGNFSDAFWEEFALFTKSDCEYMSFKWEMATIDGRAVPLTPIVPHCKVYRWHPGITYKKSGRRTKDEKCCVVPYFGRKKKAKGWHSNLKFIHYWTFTKGLEQFKLDAYYKRGQYSKIEKMFWNAQTPETEDRWFEEYRESIGKPKHFLERIYPRWCPYEEYKKIVAFIDKKYYPDSSVHKLATIGRQTRIEEYVVIRSGVKIGSKTFIKCGAIIGTGTVIGSRVFIGPGAKILHQMPDGESNPARIEDDAYIGAGAIIMPGVTVGRHAIVGAGALVTKDCEPEGVYFGSPATLRRTHDIR